MGTDVCMDMGMDAGTDVGMDTGTDAGMDVSTDMGMDLYKDTHTWHLVRNKIEIYHVYFIALNLENKKCEPTTLLEM
jgi:hypothetical protein